MRRVLGLCLGLAPLVLLLASLVSGLNNPVRPIFAGMGFMVTAAGVALLNFHLSFGRPLFFRLRHGTMDGYKFVSGFPMIGTALVVLGALFGFGAVGSAVTGVVVMLLDTGGSFWFLVSTWRDRSFWDS